MKMARTDLTIVLDLQEYFSDDRKLSKIYINRIYSKISDLEDKISEIFGIKRFHLLSEGHFLPASEDIALLRNGETISVKPNTSHSQSTMLDENYYDQSIVSFDRSVLPQDISSGKLKHKTKFSTGNILLEKQSTFSIVEERNLEQHSENDCSDKTEYILHASTPNTSNVPDKSHKTKRKRHKVTEKIATESSEANMKQEIKENSCVNDIEFKKMKSKKRKLLELSNGKTIKESSIEMKNGDIQMKDLKQSQTDLLQNDELKEVETNTVSHLTTGQCDFQPIPYKKVKNVKSWSTSPLSKSTNIVEITKVPIENIVIDLSRFDFIPVDNLTPLEPVDWKIENKNNSAEEHSINYPIKPEEKYESENICKRIEPLKSSEITNPNSYLRQLQPCSESQVKSPISLKELEQTVSSNSSDTLNDTILPDSQNSSDKTSSTDTLAKIPLLQYPRESGNVEYQNYSSDSQQIKLVNSTNTQKQIVRSQNCSNVNNESKHLKNVSSTAKVDLSENINFMSSQTKLQNSPEELQQTNSLNVPELSKNTKFENSSEQSKEPGWSNFKSRLSQLAKGVVKESRSFSRERWRLKLENHTNEVHKPLLSKSNNSDRQNQFSVFQDGSSDKKLSSETAIIKKCEVFSDYNGRQTTEQNDKNSLEEYRCNKELIANEEIMETEDGSSSLASGNLIPTDDITEESTISHETITDNGLFPEPKRKRKRKHRRKKKDEPPSLTTQKMNVGATKWATFIPAKPKIHIKFNSSDDDTPQEENDVNRSINAADQSSTGIEKIKILQDVTLDPNFNSHIDHIVKEEGVGSCQQEKPLSNNFDELLQIMKIELLKTVDAMASVD